MNEMSVQELKEMIDAGNTPVIVDVREAGELVEKPFTYAETKHIPMMEIANHLNDLDKTQTTVVMCAKGGRSGQVAMILKVQGFENIINLSGGVDAWYDAGLNG